MSIITNNHTGPLSIAGQVLQPGRPTPVHGWDEIAKNAVVARWVKDGILKVEDGAPGEQGSQFVQPDKAELQAKLDALEVKYDKRAGVAKLQALLAEAEKAKAEQGPEAGEQA